MQLHSRFSRQHSWGRQGPPLEWRVRQSGTQPSSLRSLDRRSRQMAGYLQHQSSSSPNSRHSWRLAAGCSGPSLWLLGWGGEARCRHLLRSGRQLD